MALTGSFNAAAETNPQKSGLRAGNEPRQLASSASYAKSKDAAVITAIDVERIAARTRITLKLSAPVEAAGFLLAEPERVVIDLPEVIFRLPQGAGVAAAGPRPGLAVAGYRFGLIEAGKSRIVFDLNGPMRFVTKKLEARNGGHHFIMELESTSKEEFLANLEAPAQKKIAAPAPVEKPDRQAAADDRPVVVLDPGHGGIDVGARGAMATLEKEVVLAFAQTLAEKLVASGRYKVIVTRTEDVFVSLPQRVKIARDAGAKLFISIHADTLHERWVEGATVYTVSDKASDVHAARVAEKENLADKLAGVEGVEESGDVSDILFDLTRRETRTFSHYFARSLIDRWKEAGKLNKNPIRSAGFRVLMAPDVPSILLELGYLSSRTEAARLTQPEWRAKAAQAVASSVDAFFSPLSAGAGRGHQGAGNGHGSDPGTQAPILDKGADRVSTGVVPAVH